ncbi:gamma-glutamyltransferase [Alteromonas sp. ASW11-19]|uniref:Glutathione hydrolase proenzyme n=1 Tax=Alteromonas salexigens TaxID=2982530 RepID=A0ABT2VL41_9ALTE|nr:gamma-glutamyltransferase [Alteromonas salexigens]MCU7554030.1 gamma-glutamyltransferase [Alteromonas salexigens]
MYSGTESDVAQREAREPEAATGYIDKKAVVADDYMVVAANPYAAAAGRNIIQQGGSAIDAAIAVQAMLTLVEPQSSGIGGGAFILYWDNTAQELHTFDGREIAPGAVNPQWFMQNGEVMAWRDAVVGGKSVGVPGVLKALEMAHGEFGQLPWRALFDETITTASEGFEVSPRLEKLIALDYHPGLKTFPASAAYFRPDGEPLKAGTIKKNQPLADTLTAIAKQGSAYMYEGPLAEKIVATVNEAPINPGQMSTDDLARYQAKKRKGVCGPYRSKQVCGMAPPSSGGVNVYQILKLLERFELAGMAPKSAEFAHLFAQASALTYADRARYIADTDFTQLSYDALIAEEYLSERSQLIGSQQAWQPAQAGQPYNRETADGQAFELPNTSHVVIVDKQGNAVSMTSSIEFMFGSGLMVDGFLLNNQLTDFSFNPDKGGEPVLNRVEPYKRPRSAMSPTMVFADSGELELVVGSPGGSRIIDYVAQTLIGVIDFNLNIQQAINLPKITNRNDYTALEKGTPLEALEAPLKALGHRVRIIDLNSGLHGIEIRDGKLIGGADPRREGQAVGE